MDATMQALTESFNEIWNSPSRYAVIAVAAMFIGYIPYIIFKAKKGKSNVKKFLEDHPDAAKAIILGAAKGTFTPLLVNGIKPVLGNVGMRAAIYLVPGENVIDFQYTWSRPGVMYKTVPSNGVQALILSVTVSLSLPER